MEDPECKREIKKIMSLKNGRVKWSLFKSYICIFVVLVAFCAIGFIVLSILTQDYECPCSCCMSIEELYKLRERIPIPCDPTKDL
jgi:hypothetical protein